MRRRVLLALSLAFVGCRAPQPAAPAPTTRPGPTALSRSADGLLVNPSFPVTLAAARAELEADRPKVALTRPLVICGGFLDIGLGPWLMERTLRRHVEGAIVTVSFATNVSLPGCRQRLARAVDDALGPGPPGGTREVDVIGQSLGGLISVYSALDDPAMGERVRIRRLFTICSPLSGARMAGWIPFDLFDFQHDMRQGSALYARLARTTPDYELFCYARTRDSTVGEAYSALPGRRAWWVDTPRGEGAHERADFDPRILVEILRRLRGESPLTVGPPAPLPP